MRDAASFLIRDNWAGGAWELVVDLEPGGNRLLEAARWVWSRLDLEGPYASNELEPVSQEPVRLGPGSIDSLDRNMGSITHYGVARIRGWPGKVVVSSAMCRFSPESDEFVLGLPVGALAASNPDVGSYPFGYDPDANPPWAATLDDWLADIALGLRTVVPYELARIGWLISAVEESPVYVDAEGYHRHP